MQAADSATDQPGHTTIQMQIELQNTRLHQIKMGLTSLRVKLFGESPSTVEKGIDSETCIPIQAQLNLNHELTEDIRAILEELTERI